MKKIYFIFFFFLSILIHINKGKILSKEKELSTIKPRKLTNKNSSSNIYSSKNSYLSSITKQKNPKYIQNKKNRIASQIKNQKKLKTEKTEQNPSNTTILHSSYVKGILSKAKILLKKLKERKKRHLSDSPQTEHEKIAQEKEQIKNLVTQLNQETKSENPENITNIIQQKINQSSQINKTPIIIINHDTNNQPTKNENVITEESKGMSTHIFVSSNPDLLNTDIAGLQIPKNKPVTVKDPYYVQYPFTNSVDHLYSSIKVAKAETVYFKDIDTLLDVLNFVGHLYTDIFNSLPSEGEDKEKGGLEKTMDVLRFYAKVRNFLMVVIKSRKELIEDINFLEGKVHALKTSREEMIDFYGLEHQYFKVKLKMIRYSGDKKFKSYINDLDSIQVKFESDVKLILKFAYVFGNQTSTFIKEINELQRSESSNTVLNALDKFDKIIMMTIRLIETKISLEDSMESLRHSLNNLKSNKFALAETLSNIGKIGVEEVDLKTPPLVKKFAEVFSVSLAFLFVFVL